MITVSNLASSSNKRGFTIVELIIVIIVIAILAGVVVVGYGAWRNATAANQVKNDVVAAASALESYRNQQDEYPVSIPADITPSDGVTLSLGYVYPDGGRFCVQGVHAKGGNFYVTEENTTTAVAGNCPSPPPSNAPPTSITAAKISGMNIRGTALAVTCDLGTPQYRLSHRINTGAWQTGTWSTTLIRTATYTSTSPPPNAQWVYTFKAETRCALGAVYGAEATSPDSNGVIVNGFYCPSGNAVYSGGGWICGAG